jgi:hypothetical protein
MPRHGATMRFAGERGQTAAEYAGALLIVAVVVGAVATTNVGGTIRRAASAQVCKIAGGGECADRHAAGTPRRLLDADPVAHAANIPCDGLTPKQCTALRGLINRMQAEHREAVERYVRFAADFATWVAAAEGIADVKDVIYRPGLFKAVNALLRKQTNREGARLLTSVTNKPLSNLIKSNYRYGARIGKGSTADALRDEVARGVKYGAKKSHYKKAQESIRRLNRILDDESLSARERQIAGNIRGELWTALPPRYRVPLR